MFPQRSVRFFNVFSTSFYFSTFIILIVFKTNKFVTAMTLCFCKVRYVFFNVFTISFYFFTFIILIVFKTNKFVTSNTLCFGKGRYGFLMFFLLLFISPLLLF